MEQTTFPVYKSKPIKPLLFSSLITSTPESHQISKRIKGLQGYSEHYKDNRVDYPIVGSKFSPLRTRDYRKTREFTLEIWDPMIQISFLERFLKPQKNVHHLRIKVLTEKEYEGKILKRVCEILSKMEKLNRVHIDFAKMSIGKIEPNLLEDIKCMRLLPRLKDLNITSRGEQVLPFSVSLTKVGYTERNILLQMQNVATLQKVIEKTLKFNQFETIRIESKKLNLMDKFFNDLAFVISKLPNFRKLRLNYSKDGCSYLPSHFLDSLAANALNIEILKLGLPGGKDLISLLKHPIFKAKSLRRASFSLGFTDGTADYLNEVFDLLGEIPSLYELCLRFSTFIKFENEISEDHFEKLSRMTNLRKLRILFDFSKANISEQKAGDIFRSIFNKMHFLEELELHIPRKCLGLNARDIQGLPRLKKASFHFMRSLLEKGGDPTYANFLNSTLPKEKSDMVTKGEGSDMETIMEILGKCGQLRELDLKMLDCVSDYAETAVKLSESLSKLKRLQVFRMNAMPGGDGCCNMTMEALENLVMTCHKLRDLQDLAVFFWGVFFVTENYQEFSELAKRLRTNKKYRVHYYSFTG